MIFKAIVAHGSGSMAHAAASVQYAERDDHAPADLTGTALSRVHAYVHRASANPVPLDPDYRSIDSLVAELEQRASLRPDIERPFQHLVLAYHPEDNATISTAMRADIANQFIHRMVSTENAKRIREGRNPDLMPDPDQMLHHWVSHNDKDHPHDHGILCRIDGQGKVYYASMDRVHGQQILRDLEKEYNLRPLRVQDQDQGVQAIERITERDPIAMAAQDAWLSSKDWDGFVQHLGDQQIAVEEGNRGYRFHSLPDDRVMAGATAGFRSDCSLKEIRHRWKLLDGKAPSPIQVRREYMAVQNRAVTAEAFQRALAIRQMMVSDAGISHRGRLYTMEEMKLRDGSVKPPTATKSAQPVPLAKPSDDPWADLESHGKAARSARFKHHDDIIGIINRFRSDAHGPIRLRLQTALETRGYNLFGSKEDKVMNVKLNGVAMLSDEEQLALYADVVTATRTSHINRRRQELWANLVKRVERYDGQQPLKLRIKDEGELGRLLGAGCTMTATGVKGAGEAETPWGYLGLRAIGAAPWVATAKQPEHMDWRRVRTRDAQADPPWITIKSIEWKGIDAAKTKGPSWS